MDRVENMLKHMDAADVIILAVPVYQNSVPGLVMEFFETVHNSRNILIRKERKLLVIANSGFAERGAGSGAIKTCMLFARDNKKPGKRQVFWQATGCKETITGQSTNVPMSIPLHPIRFQLLLLC